MEIYNVVTIEWPQIVGAGDGQAVVELEFHISASTTAASQNSGSQPLPEAMVRHVSNVSMNNLKHC